jgi:hypothetical protein
MDLCLHGLSGIDLVARLRARWPELRVSSGSSEAFARAGSNSPAIPG